MSIVKIKPKIGILSPITQEWIHLHYDKIDITHNINETDFILYESNGDPIHIIENIKKCFPKKKLIFILSGDQNAHIDNECIWFSNAVKPSGLASRQTQIFVINQAILKFYEHKTSILDNKIELELELDKTTNSNLNSEIHNRSIDICFKGTIWDGMRTDMYNNFSIKPKCEIIKNNQYWTWRLNSPIKPTQLQLENVANDLYKTIIKSKLCLCPKGNGNSSMRIIEALVCGSIPVLINDFTSPFSISWGRNIDEFCLSFNTEKDNWDFIYNECIKLLEDKPRLEKMQQNGKNYFKNVIYIDSKMPKFKMYNNIDSVCFGFSKLIIDKIIDIFAQIEK